MIFANIHLMAISILKVVVIVLMLCWLLFWKAYSVWTAARNGHKKWFIALIVLNTLSILDIFYVFYVVKKKPMDLINTIKRFFKFK
jgi:hypothetical protein